MRRRLVWLGVLGVLVGGAFFLRHIERSSGSSIACGSRYVLIKGRLIDSTTDRPVKGAEAWLLPSRADATSRERLDYYRRLDEDCVLPADPAQGRSALRRGGSTRPASMSADDGSFQLLLEVSFSISYDGLGDIVSETEFGRHTMSGVLRVERAGSSPILLELPSGSWSEETTWEGLSAVWDWGDVRVPGTG